VNAPPENSSPERAPSPGAARPPLVRARAVALGLALSPVLCGWAMRTEIISGGSELIEASLMPLVVFALFGLTLLNDAVRRRRPGLALTRAEMLVVYVMQAVSVGVAGLGQVQFLNQVLAGMEHGKTAQNHWGDWQRFVPPAWVPDPAVLPDYFHGGSSFWTPAHLRGWAAPILVWSGFLLTLWFSFGCVATLLRRAWVEEERLPFPLAALPLALTDDNPDSGAGGGLLRRRSFQTAFGLTALYRSVSGLHRLYPAFPDWPGVGFKGQLIDVAGGLTTPPWNAVDYLRLSLHPMIAGVTYFVPQDVSFSVWFFYLTVKAEAVLAAALGLRDAGAPSSARDVPYTGEQGAGAFLALACLSLWAARRHLAATLRKAMGRAPDVRDDDEALSYRAAWGGLALSLVALVAFFAWGGLAWYLGLAFFALYGLMMVAAARLRAEAGPMLGYGPDLNPHRMLVDLPGSRAWGARDLTAFSYAQWFDSDYRTAVLPQQAEALKITEAGDLPARALGCWSLTAAALATVASLVCVLTIYYHYGAATGRGDNGWRAWNGQAPFVQLQAWVTSPAPAAPVRAQWLALGFALTLLLGWLRTLFVWWPLHPAGFALAQAGFGINWVWFPTLLGWAAKALILRYGGTRVYRRGVPFFLGLILGDITTACVWSVLGVLLDTQMYMFFPG